MTAFCPYLRHLYPSSMTSVSVLVLIALRGSRTLFTPPFFRGRFLLITRALHKLNQKRIHIHLLTMTERIRSSNYVKSKSNKIKCTLCDKPVLTLASSFPGRHLEHLHHPPAQTSSVSRSEQTCQLLRYPTRYLSYCSA